MPIFICQLLPREAACATSDVDRALAAGGLPMLFPEAFPVKPVNELMDILHPPRRQ
jgi:hypothetical protein